MTDKQAISAAAVEKIITADISACERLLVLLEDENTALQERNLDTLQEIIEEKSIHLNHLEMSAKTRTQWMEGHQGDNLDKEWQQLLAEFKQPSLAQAWEKLKQLQNTCRERNEINGRILTRSQQTYGRLLNILRGQNTSADLYTQSGAKTNNTSSCSVGEA